MARAALLDAEELAYAAEVIAPALQDRDARSIAANLYGDEILAFQGHEGVGLPPFAGFAVAAALSQGEIELNGWVD